MSLSDAGSVLNLPMASMNYTGEPDSYGPLFRIDPNRSAEDEWTMVEGICSKLFTKFISEYTGRDQQKKGQIMRAAQKILFGTELPRGHGHKGKLSTKMSALYDELTGRQPRKRKSKTNSIQTSKRPNLRPQTILVGVIGRGDYAKLIIERLLLQHHQVITVNQDTYANVCSDASFSQHFASIRENSLQLQTNLAAFCNACDIIFVAIPDDSIAVPFYVNKDSFLDMVGPKHYIVDLCIEDLENSGKVHARAKERDIRYYDCLLFPQPTTLASFEKNEPVVLLGGEPLLSDFLRTVLAGLGRLTFTGGSNQSIFFKMIMSQYMIIQQQVLMEVYSTARSLGINDPKLLGHLLSCVDPARIIERNRAFRSYNRSDQLAMTVPIKSLTDAIKHYFTLPSVYFPVTSAACKAGEEAIRSSSNAQADVSHMWDLIFGPEAMGPSLQGAKV